MAKFLLQIILGFVCLVCTHAALIVAHDLGWYPDRQLARLMMASPDMLQVDWFRWGLVAVIAIIAWGVADYFLYRKKRPADNPTASDDKPSGHTLTQFSPPVPAGFYTKKWVLNYNPTNPKGRKNLSFNEDGTIGEGRNHNEYRWSYANNHLDIIRQNSDLQNRFKYDPTTARFICTNDLDARGTNHHVIYQGRV